MIWYFKLSWIGLVCFLIGLPAQSFALAAQIGLPKTLSNSVPPSIPQLARSLEPSEMSDGQLYELARSITVKVLCGKQWGSGILISKKGTIYQVLTNAHVLRQSCGTKISIQTPDNRVYTVSSTKQLRHGEYDLSVVSFNSGQNYAVASLKTTNSYVVESDVFATGFPLDTEETRSSGFVFKSGQIKAVSAKSFEDGYQIGYTSQVEKGMSGGPLLNRWGQVIGINGIQSDPPWGSPYTFDDGSTPTKAVWEQMQQLSWAIPIRTFVNLGSGSLGRVNDVTVVPPPVTGLETTVSPTVLLGGQTEDIDYSATKLDASVSPSSIRESQPRVSNPISPPTLIEDQTEDMDYSAAELETPPSSPDLKGKRTEGTEYSTLNADQPIW